MIQLPGILHDDTVTIVTTTIGLPDADGLPTTTTIESVWEGVNVQQVQADELDNHQQDTNTTYYRVAGSQPPVPVKASDRIKWRGEEYLVDGQPDVRTGPYRLEHVALRMYRSNG